jgi:hypothetical protein
MSSQFEIPKRRFAHMLRTILIFSMGAGYAATQAGAQNQLCFTQVTGLPVESSPGVFSNPANPPLIPGATCGISGSPACPATPEADTGWYNAFRYTIETGTELPNQPTDGAIQAIRQNNKLYFSFELNNLAGTFNNNSDKVLLAFANYPPTMATPPANAEYTWIVINGPFTATSGNAAQAVPAGQIQVYQGASTASNQLVSGQLSSPAWLQAGMFGEPAGSQYSWWLVVSVDNSSGTNGPQLPAAGQFGIFLDAIAAQTETLTDTQATLFAEPFLPVSTLPISSNFATSPFSAATLSNAAGCTGLSITSGDITNTVDGAITDSVSSNGALPNHFQVKVHNSGVDAPAVTATFRIANFGLPSPDQWQLLGFDACTAAAAANGGTAPSYCTTPFASDSPSGNPTAPTDVPAVSAGPPGSCGDTTADGCSTLPAGPWSLKSSNASYYTYPDNQHECVRVDLSSTVGTATFLNNSAFNNFFFNGTASTFTSFPAFVSARYPATGAGDRQTFHLKAIRKPMNGAVAQTLLSRVGRHSAVSVGRDANYLGFIVDGCRLSGKTLSTPVLNADGRPTEKTLTFQNCDSVGSYGYLIRHDGPVDSWNYNLAASGTGVSLAASTTTPDLYTLVIPQGQTAQIVTTVNPGGSSGGSGAAAAGKFAVFLDLGANFPQGSLSSSFNTGFSLNAGLEYIATSHLSAEGIFGYHHLAAKAGGGGDIYQFSTDAKYYLTTSTIRPFANAGIGGYAFHPGSTYFGGNVGGGVLYTLGPHWGIQGSYNFHAVNTPGSASQFSTFQGGLRYVF